MASNAVVLVFAHSPHLKWHERISLEQCFRILGRHPIRLVCPEGMALDDYRRIVPELKCDPVPPKWMRSIRSYNRLKILPFLYRKYGQFEFMLTHELDALVFRDELDKWCSEGWDYIGAPWFESFDEATSQAKPRGVGNSGFSLRRIGTMLRISTSLRYQTPAREVIRAWKTGQYRLRQVASSLTFRNNFFGAFNDYGGHEDRFWCEVAAQRFADFRLAPYAAASRFAFEVNPGRLFAEAGGTLPFGCHKWMGYEPEFWRPHIERLGYRWQ